MGHRRALVDHQALDLEELGRVAGVDGLVAEAATGQQRADRRPLLVHDPDLARARVGAQQPGVDVEVERVPQVPRRVVGRDVEHLEVGDVVLDLGALVDDEAELGEDLGDLAGRLDDRVQGAAADRPAGRRDVRRLGGEACRELRAAQASGGPRPARPPRRRGPRSRWRRPSGGPRRAARRSRAGSRSARPSCPGPRPPARRAPTCRARRRPPRPRATASASRSLVSWARSIERASLSVGVRESRTLERL